MTETRRIRYEGPPARAGVLVHMLEEQGVSVEWEPPHEQRGPGADTEAVVVNLVTWGTIIGITAAVRKFRERLPSVKVEVEGDDPGGTEGDRHER